MKFSLVNYCRGEKLIVEKDHFRIARSPYKIKLPSNYYPNLAYLAGYHLGDGFLYDYNMPKDKGTYEITYADEHKSQIENVIAPIFKQHFGIDLHIRKMKSNMWIGRINCKIIHMFLHQILQMPIGKKGNFLSPKWVLENDIFLKEFVSGFFDAEGSIFISNHRKANITLTNTNYKILEEIHNLLRCRFGIIFGRIYKKHNILTYEIKTSAKDTIIKFCTKIGFKHPNKIAKMNDCLKHLKKIHSRPLRSAAATVLNYY